MLITESSLECIDCDWIGDEGEAVYIDTADGREYRCPDCNEECAHFPLDELGVEVLAEQKTALLKQTVKALEEANSDTVKAIAVMDKASVQLERCRVRRTEGK